MAYDNIPGTKAVYNDGAFRIPTGSNQPKILILGSASSGLTDELFNVADVNQTETEFGSASEILQGAHEALAQGADNLAVMRIGGRPGSFVFTDSATATLTITPEARDDNVMGRYALIMDGTGSANRIVIYDLMTDEYVYDSDQILALDEGIVDVQDTGIDLFSVGDLSDVTTFIALDALVSGDFTAEGVATVSSVVATEGTDGTSMSIPEYYAALSTAYHLLDYRDADFVSPRGVYVDSPNVADTGATANYFKGVPAAGLSYDELGYAWHYIYRGKMYTYLTDKPTYFSVVKAAATRTVLTDLVLTAQKQGTGGNGISIQVNAAGAAGPTVTISEPTDTTLKILVTDDGTGTTLEARTAINTALGLYTTNSGVLASTLVAATGGAGTLLTTLINTSLTGGTGGHVLTHLQLTGEAIPSAVSTAFSAATDSQLREVNFGHQLADFCWRASTSWKTILGGINFLPPPGLSREDVADWIGDAPIYVKGPDGSTDIVTQTSDNGSGVLGFKFLAGFAASGGGYRNDQIPEAASSIDGLAYGGFIKTKGAALPNYNDFPDHAYGIDDTDERLDRGGFPVDIGKHIFVCYDHPVHRNNYNGGQLYRGPVACSFLGKLAIMPENEEPIGPNGRITKVTAVPRVHATQLDQLSRIRAIGLRREEGIGIVFTTAKTAAHPDSDYTRASTIRCVNRELEGLRRIARQYIGKPFSVQRVVALQSAMEVFLQGERLAGFNQGARATIKFSKADRVMGRLTIELRMVPPFSIELITVETSLAADEAEL